MMNEHLYVTGLAEELDMVPCRNGPPGGLGLGPNSLNLSPSEERGVRVGVPG
jgi:hypothetical protein